MLSYKNYYSFFLVYQTLSYFQVTVKAGRLGVVCCDDELLSNETSRCCLLLFTGGVGNGPKSISETPLSRFSELLFTDL